MRNSLLLPLAHFHRKILVFAALVLSCPPPLALRPCAGYVGHPFTKLRSCARPIALISHFAFMK